MITLIKDSLPCQATLVIEDSKYQRKIPLHEKVYSIGRHSSNSIVILSEHISRHHATVVCKPRENHSPSFWIVDGDLQGKKSKNGIVVNEQKCLEHELQHGDVIKFGDGVQAYYLELTQAKNRADKPLGEILQEADLVSASQVKIALQDQEQYSELRIGEILSLRGWIKQETADFFAEHWHKLKTGEPKQPLGQYLKQAALLDENQIQTIVCEQEQTNMKFGSLAVYKGWLKQTTVNFFLNALSPSDAPKNLTRTINTILSSKQITRQQQLELFEMMMNHSDLSSFEQAKVQEICDRLATRELYVIE